MRYSASITLVYRPRPFIRIESTAIWELCCPGTHRSAESNVQSDINITCSDRSKSYKAIFTSNGFLTTAAPRCPFAMWYPEWEWYQCVPASSATNLYRKVVLGAIGHCVTIGTPSIQGDCIWRKPCQWIVADMPSISFDTSTTMVSPWQTNIKGPGIFRLMETILRSIPLAVTHCGWKQCVRFPRMQSQHALEEDEMAEFCFEQGILFYIIW